MCPIQPLAVQAEPPSEAPEADDRGFDAIAEWTGGAAPESFEELRAVRDLDAAYPLLRALVGRSPREFLVRAAAVETLVKAGEAFFAPDAIDRALYFLDEAAREATVRALRLSGWLEFVPGQGTRLTAPGQWAFEVLSILHRAAGESDLLPTVEGVQYALRAGMDPIRALHAMRARLVALREEIEAARASHSEVILRRAADKLGAALDLSRRIREVLDQVPLDDADARQVTRELHDLLSRLHGVSAQLQAEITELGRQYLRLTAGMTIEQVVSALMRLRLPELAAAGKAALLPVARPPPLLSSDVVGALAEQHFLRERRVPPELVWKEPPEARRMAHDDREAAPEVAAFLDDLLAAAERDAPTPFSVLLPREDRGEAFLRANLLPLVGEPRAGEGFAAQLGALALDPRAEGEEGWPVPVSSPSLTALTPGAVLPRR